MFVSANHADRFFDYLRVLFTQKFAHIVTRSFRSDYARMYSTHRFAPRALSKHMIAPKVRSVCRDGGCVPQTIGNVVKVLASVDRVTALHNTRNASRIRQTRDENLLYMRFEKWGRKVSLAQFLCEILIPRHFRSLLRHFLLHLRNAMLIAILKTSFKCNWKKKK